MKQRLRGSSDDHSDHYSSPSMAAIQLSKTAFTLPPTVRTLASGVPSASLLNIAVRAPAHGHEHGHAHGVVGPRSDVPAPWAASVSATSSGLVSRTFASGTSYSAVRIVL